MMCWSAFSKELDELVRISRIRELGPEETKSKRYAAEQAECLLILAKRNR